VPAYAGTTGFLSFPRKRESRQRGVLLGALKETFLADEGEEEVAYASVELLRISLIIGLGIRGVQTSQQE